MREINAVFRKIRTLSLYTLIIYAWERLFWYQNTFQIFILNAKNICNWGLDNILTRLI